MKTNILSKITLICLSFICFNCTKDKIENSEMITETKSSYTISYNQNNRKAQSNNSLSNRINGSTYKYLKLVYSPTSIKELVRNTYNATTTTGHSIIEIDSNTDIWIFNEVDQPAIDSLFTISNWGICYLCNYIDGQPEYIVVADICYDAFTSESNKQVTRNNFPELLHVIINSIDCETWIMKECCLSQEECPIGGVTEYVSDVNEVQ